MISAGALSSLTRFNGSPRQKYALCDLPTSKFPDVTSGVTLATPREHEVAGYGYPENGFTGLERLIDICRMKSVHAVYAATKDFMYVIRSS